MIAGSRDLIGLSRDFWLGLGCAAAGVAGLVLIRLQVGALTTPGSLLPLFGALACILVGLGMSVQEFRRPLSESDTETAQETETDFARWRFALIVALVFAIGFVTKYVGLLVAAVLVQLSLFLLMSKTSPIRALIVTGATVAGLYTAISIVLGVQIPVGTLWAGLI